MKESGNMNNELKKRCNELLYYYNSHFIFLEEKAIQINHALIIKKLLTKQN